jgi:hypothetical protein
MSQISTPKRIRPSEDADITSDTAEIVLFKHKTQLDPLLLKNNDDYMHLFLPTEMAYCFQEFLQKAKFRPIMEPVISVNEVITDDVNLLRSSFLSDFTKITRDLGEEMSSVSHDRYMARLENQDFENFRTIRRKINTWFTRGSVLSQKLNRPSCELDLLQIGLKFDQSVRHDSIEAISSKVRSLKKECESTLLVAAIEECTALNESVVDLLSKAKENEDKTVYLIVCKAYRTALLSNRDFSRDLLRFIPKGGNPNRHMQKKVYFKRPHAHFNTDSSPTIDSRKSRVDSSHLESSEEDSRKRTVSRGRDKSIARPQNDDTPVDNQLDRRGRDSFKRPQNDDTSDEYHGDRRGRVKPISRPQYDDTSDDNQRERRVRDRSIQRPQNDDFPTYDNSYKQKKNKYERHDSFARQDSHSRRSSWDNSSIEEHEPTGRPSFKRKKQHTEWV